MNDRVYLCSPETAAAAGVFRGCHRPARAGDLMAWPDVKNPEQYILDDSSITSPPEDARRVEIVTGPNIVPFPDFDELPEELACEVIIKVGDNVSTDTIMPAGNKVLPFRSNIPAISQFVFEQIDPGFPGTGEREGERCGDRRRQLRPGLQPRACGPCAALPGDPRQDREELRPHPQGEPDQLRHPAAHLQGPGGLRLWSIRGRWWSLKECGIWLRPVQKRFRLSWREGDSDPAGGVGSGEAGTPGRWDA